MSQITKLFILGNHVQALGLARMASDMRLHVTIFNDYGASIARFSNSCDRFVIYRDKAHLLGLLLDPQIAKDTVLVATNDDLVGFMVQNYDKLGESYYLSIPAPEVVDICFNKINTYKRAIELGIPIPASHFPVSLKEMEDLAGRIHYPVILKPAVMHTFHKATRKKVFFCANAKSLIDNYQKVIQIIPPSEVIVQQFLTGGAKALYSFGSFFADGEVIGGFTANRIRQKPMDFGISTCFARTVINPEIERLATNFLQAINYFGLSEVEFMYDKESGLFHLIEINPRAWKWHSIANKLDINLLEMMIRYLDDLPVIKKLNTKPDVGWIERLTDTYVVLGELFRGRLTLAEYWNTLHLPKESAVWSLRDPLPAIMYLVMTPYLLFKRN